MKVETALLDVAENISHNSRTMSAQDGHGLGAPTPAATYLLGAVDNALTSASHQLPFLESRSDQINLSPAPDTLTAARSVQSGLTTAPASPPSKSATPDDAEATAAAPYGTRSRQRTSGSRPNYAEDKDVDMDTEMNGTHAKAMVAHGSGVIEESYSLGTSWEAPTRRGFSAVNGTPKSASGNAQVPKDSIPGTSTFAANPTTTTSSKKRKQPGASVTTTTVTSHSVPARPKGSAGSSSRLQPETNMMTFERCGGYLNATKQLKADDGTAISVNGETSSLSNIEFC